MKFLIKSDTICTMGNKTRNVRYPEWINQAVTEFAKKNSFENDSKAFIWLLSTQLNRYGYFEENYSDMVDLPLTEDLKNPNQTLPEISNSDPVDTGFFNEEEKRKRKKA